MVVVDPPDHHELNIIAICRVVNVVDLLNRIQYGTLKVAEAQPTHIFDTNFVNDSVDRADLHSPG